VVVVEVGGGDLLGVGNNREAGMIAGKKDRYLMGRGKGGYLLG
jgi:hypothetical protein